MGRSQVEDEDQWTLEEGQQAPIGGLHEHALMLHVRLGRSRIKILMAVSSRRIGRSSREWTLVNQA